MYVPQLHSQSKFPEFGRQILELSSLLQKANVQQAVILPPKPKDIANTQQHFFGNDSICANAEMSFNFSIVTSQLHGKCDVGGHKVAEVLCNEGSDTLLFQVHPPEAHSPSEMGFISLFLQ